MEIGLIKLCQPVMETNLDSLYDRVRVLEEKLEKGLVLPDRSAEGRGDPGTQPYGEEFFSGDFSPDRSAPESEKKPEKAAPEDLQYVRKNWNSIIRETKGLLQQMLLESTPKYDGNTGEPVLYVEFRNFLAQTCIDNPQSTELLRQAIRKKIGKDVEVKMILKNSEAGKGPAGLAEISVDDLIRQNINMDITVENMDDE